VKKSLFVAIVLAAGFFGGLVVSGRMSLTSPSVAAPETQSKSALAPAAGALPDLSAVAERAVQASVNISSTQQVPVEPFFQLFYGAGSVEPQTSLGSGVFVSTDGFILTNSHVVQSPDAEIRVTLADNREFDARVIGVDPLTDLAVLKVAIKDAAPLPWGNSGTLRIAEWVLAVGNPFSFNQTVTLGIVSAVNRHDPQLATYNDFIQTDAAINPGNSGGALVNSRGELVGINTMIYSQTGGYQGLGFAVPANLARSIMEQLKTNREIVRGSIGQLMLHTMDAAVAQRYPQLKNTPGVVILDMWRNQPAHQSGLRPGDIITAFNGKPVKEESELERLIAAAPVNSTARVEVIRDGNRRTFEVPVVKMPPPRRRM
jgi:S1-C subfamily serine protease